MSAFFPVPAVDDAPMPATTPGCAELSVAVVDAVPVQARPISVAVRWSYCRHTAYQAYRWQQAERLPLEAAQGT